MTNAFEPETVSTSPALQPPPGNPRFPLFDSLRGVAILMVVVFHAAGTAKVTHGTWAGALALQLFVGVLVFFTLSGFLIYRPFVAARAAGRPAPRLATYARRRVLRILPAYWLALTVLTVAGAVNGVDGDDWWRFYGFLQIYDARTFSLGIPVAWSLCVEITFYLALPFYAALVTLAARGGRSWVRVEVVALSFIVLGSLAFRGLVSARVVDPVLASSLPGVATFFAIGMGLAVASVALAEREESSRLARAVFRRSGLCWALAALALGLAAIPFGVTTYSQPESSWSDWYGNYVFSALTALFLVAPAVFGQAEPGLPRRLLRSPLLSWVGLVSYGLFLWHLPLLVKIAGTGFGEIDIARPLILFAAALASGTIAAAASYYVVELPFLRLKEPRRQRAAP